MVTITPTGVTQPGTDVALIGNVRVINVRVKDRYWSVGGGVQGSSVLGSLTLGGSSFTIPDFSSNNAPTIANAIGDEAIRKGEYVDVPLAGVFSDPDGDGLNYAARSSDRTVATLAVNSDRIRITGVAGGTATINVTAHDSKGGRVTDSFTVTVIGAGNSPPLPENPNDQPPLPPVPVGQGGSWTPPSPSQQLEIAFINWGINW